MFELQEHPHCNFENQMKMIKLPLAFRENEFIEEFPDWAGQDVVLRSFFDESFIRQNADSQVVGAKMHLSISFKANFVTFFLNFNS